MVEYVGETVRRSVVGLREARDYDARCGAGTYVFGMSAGFCMDATTVGIISRDGALTPEICSPIASACSA